MEDCTSWRDLPEDLQEQVLARLPLEFVGRFCTVCKEWNALLSSTRFIKTLWAQTPPNRNPWLLSVARDADGGIVCKGYSFITKTWEKRFSFSFLQAAVGNVTLYWVASTAGLCIVDVEPEDSRREISPGEDSFLCNPLTRTFLKLPSISSRESIGIVGGEGDRYKIVAFSEWRDGGHMKVSIYDPSQKKWTIAGQLPMNLRISNRRMVSCKDSVYCFVEMEDREPGIVGFNIRDGTSTVIPLPELSDVITPHFFASGERLLLVGFIDIDVQVEVRDESEFEDEDEHLVIWELQENMARSSNSPPSSLWKEIARRSSGWIWSFDCVGAGDYVFFFPYSSRYRDILSYNLSEQLWQICERHDRYSDLVAFEPRPDMKVE